MPGKRRRNSSWLPTYSERARCQQTKSASSKSAIEVTQQESSRPGSSFLIIRIYRTISFTLTTQAIEAI
jgi:hypothetical protein